VAPQKVVRRIEWSEDRLELRVVRVDDDFGRVEAEPVPPARLEPVRAFRADQSEQAARRCRPLEFKHCARIGLKAGTRHGQLSPSVHNREGLEESSADAGERASADKNASQPGGRLDTDELSRSGAEVYREPAAPCADLEDAPPIDLELGKNLRMNGLGLTDCVPELRFELIYHRPKQSSPEPLSCLCVAPGGRFAFSAGDLGEVFGWQPIDVIKAVPLPARRGGRHSLEVIHL
jgi:hypothetical protein